LGRATPFLPGDAQHTMTLHPWHRPRRTLWGAFAHRTVRRAHKKHL